MEERGSGMDKGMGIRSWWGEWGQELMRGGMDKGMGIRSWWGEGVRSGWGEGGQELMRGGGSGVDEGEAYHSSTDSTFGKTTKKWQPSCAWKGLSSRSFPWPILPLYLNTTLSNIHGYRLTSFPLYTQLQYGYHIKSKQEKRKRTNRNE